MITKSEVAEMVREFYELMDVNIIEGARVMGNKKTSHAPGPWRVEQVAGKTVEIGVASGIGKRLVFKGDFRLPDCALANAALIAAAPEMLEALELMVHHAPNGECESVIRGLIAKARGE